MSSNPPPSADINGLLEDLKSGASHLSWKDFTVLMEGLGFKGEWTYCNFDNRWRFTHKDDLGDNTSLDVKKPSLGFLSRAECRKVWSRLKRKYPWALVE